MHVWDFWAYLCRYLICIIPSLNQALKLRRQQVQINSAELPPQTNVHEREANITVSLCPKEGGNKQTNSSTEECVSLSSFRSGWKGNKTGWELTGRPACQLSQFSLFVSHCLSLFLWWPLPRHFILPLSGHKSLVTALPVGCVNNGIVYCFVYYAGRD